MVVIGLWKPLPQWHIKYWPWAHATFTDITNQYVLAGVKGGLITMSLFIILCYQSVKSLGRSALIQETVENQKLYWGVTVMMVVHCISFLSVSYFGQITMLFYLTIAIAAMAFTFTRSSDQEQT